MEEISGKRVFIMKLANNLTMKKIDLENKIVRAFTSLPSITAIILILDASLCIQSLLHIFGVIIW